MNFLFFKKLCKSVDW